MLDLGIVFKVEHHRRARRIGSTNNNATERRYTYIVSTSAGTAASGDTTEEDAARADRLLPCSSASLGLGERHQLRAAGALPAWAAGVVMEPACRGGTAARAMDHRGEENVQELVQAMAGDAAEPPRPWTMAPLGAMSSVPSAGRGRAAMPRQVPCASSPRPQPALQRTVMLAVVRPAGLP